MIRLRAYNSNPWGHGGERRTAQIEEIISSAGIPSVTISNAMRSKVKPWHLSAMFSSFAMTVGFIARNRLRVPLRTLFGKAYRGTAVVMRLRNQKTSANPVFLWESPKAENVLYPLLLKRRHCKIVGFCHNLESLVPAQTSGLSRKQAPDWLNEEVAALKLCDVVFTSSKEEALLLRLFRVNARYFPYFPPREVVDWLEEIKELRRGLPSSNSRKKILMLGSAFNPPTRTGMLDRIHFFSVNAVDSIELHIAGFGTELLQVPESHPENLHIHGPLSNDELKNLLASVNAVLLHQPTTTGALTRIPEMNLAGVPVIANFNAARNYYNLPGVHVYSDDKSLLGLLKGADLTGPTQGEDHAQYTQDFAEMVRNHAAVQAWTELRD